MGFFSSTIGVQSRYFTEDGFVSVTRDEAIKHIRETVFIDYLTDNFPDFSEDAIKRIVKTLMKDERLISRILTGQIDLLCRDYKPDEDDEEDYDEDYDEDDEEKEEDN